MQRKPFDLLEYGRSDSEKLEKMLDLVLKHIQENAPTMQFKNDEERNNFIFNIAQGLLAHSDENVKTKEFILSPPFILDLCKLVKGATKAAEMSDDKETDEEAIGRKIAALLKTDLINKKDITKEELKLQLEKLLTPTEIKKLDAALEKTLQDTEFKSMFQFKPEPPKPTPQATKKSENKQDEHLDRLMENLYGLRGSIPVVVTCFLGNSMIAKVGPTYETDLSQISSRLITSSPNSAGDYLGLKNDAADLLEGMGVDVKAIVDGIVGELKRPSNIPGR